VTRIVAFNAGVTVAAVPTHMRSFASANSTLIYNLIGYFGMQ
jgi:hypothetical protein